MLEAIFDDGLQEHAGNEGFESVFVELLDDFEIVAAEPGYFDVEIVVNEFKFFVKWNKGFVLAQQAPQNIAEFQDDAASGVGIEADQSGDGVEGVEEEMGIDLAGERVHAGFEEQLLVALEIHFDASVVPDFQRRGDRHERGDDCESEPPVPSRIDGEKPFGLGGVNERDAAEFETDAGKERGHFPGGLRAAQEANNGARDVEESEGAKIPDVFFVGDGLTDEAADEACGGGRGHAQPFVTDEGGKGDDGAAEGTDNASAQEAHQEGAFEREIGEAVWVADEAQGYAEDERRHHEEHEL